MSSRRLNTEGSAKAITATATQSDWRLAAVRARDPSADGRFFCGVTTTGIYCRPSCPSRPARREHIVFFESSADAERAGYRPCKRCHPREASSPGRGAAQVAALCRLIENSEAVPTLDQLANHLNLSAFHTHRLFRSATGLTPRMYAAARQGERIRKQLRATRTVTEAIYGAGYRSSGRFYEQSSKLLGMTPTEFKAGGAGLAIRFAVEKCSLGMVLVAASSRGVCAIMLGDDRAELAHQLERQFPQAELGNADPAFGKLVSEVIASVDRPEIPIKLPLDIRGTAFQQRVWKVLSEIPAGKTMGYSEVARAIGAPKAVRAVARACASNPLAVAIPCHRVVHSDGSISGYRWGVERKRELLAREERRGKK